MTNRPGSDVNWHEADLKRLPADVQASADIRDGDVRWGLPDARRAIDAVADAGFIILGLDLQGDYADGTVTETPWSARDPDPDLMPSENAQRARIAALQELDEAVAYAAKWGPASPQIVSWKLNVVWGGADHHNAQ